MKSGKKGGVQTPAAFYTLRREWDHAVFQINIADQLFFRIASLPHRNAKKFELLIPALKTKKFNYPSLTNKQT